MMQCTYTYDLFDTTRGILTVEFDIIDKVTESGHIPNELIKRHIETRTRNLICDQLEKMRKQRSENYRYGEYWNRREADALTDLSRKIATARNIQVITKFVNYCQAEIGPLLQIIQPSESSRFYDRFIEKCEKLSNILEKIRKNPAFADILKDEKQRDFAV